MEHAIAQLDESLHDPSGTPGWMESMKEGLEELRSALVAHVEEVESGDGILEDVLDLAPHLQGRVHEIRGEHGHLVDLADFAIQTLQGIENVDGASARSLRLRVNALLSGLALHRQNGAELVYDAYNYDITEGD